MDYNCTLVDLPTTIRSFVRANPDGSYTIVINARLGHDEQCAAYVHELNHILYKDFDDTRTDVVERRTHETSRNLCPGFDG